MANDRTDPADQIPEADRVEQLTPLDPGSLTDVLHRAPSPDAAADLVDEADRLEQDALLPEDAEEDYPHDPAEQ